jgi:hypothetical protein
MKPEVVNIPVPTMLATTKTVAEKGPISLFSSLLFNVFFKAVYPYVAMLGLSDNGLREFIKDLSSIQVKPVPSDQFANMEEALMSSDAISVSTTAETLQA